MSKADGAHEPSPILGMAAAILTFATELAAATARGGTQGLKTLNFRCLPLLKSAAGDSAEDQNTMLSNTHARTTARRSLETRSNEIDKCTQI